MRSTCEKAGSSECLLSEHVWVCMSEGVQEWAAATYRQVCFCLGGLIKTAHQDTPLKD